MKPLHGDDSLVLTLGSGDTLRVHEIGLFQAPAVEKVATLRAEASALLGSSQGGGIGLLGTPSVAFALEAGALSLVQSIAANKSAGKAIELLREADKRHYGLCLAPRFFHVSVVENIDLPQPQRWRAKGPAEVVEHSVSHLQKWELQDFLAKHNKTNQDVSFGVVKLDVEYEYVVNDSEFILVKVDARPLYVRWSEVARYDPRG